MAGFSFHSGGKRCIRPILEKYQSGMVRSSVLLQCEPLIPEVPSHGVHSVEYNVVYQKKGESEGYNVKTKEKDFPISNYPLEQTEFYYEQKQGMDSFYFSFPPTSGCLELSHKGRDRLGHEKNKEFDYKMFNHRNDTKDDSFYMTHLICLISSADA